MTWLWCGYSQPLFFASGSYCRHVAQLIFCETYGSTMKGRVQWLFVISGVLIHVVTRVWILLVGGSRLQSEYMGVVLPNKKVLFIWLLFFFLFRWESLLVYLFIVFVSNGGCVPTWMDYVDKMGLAEGSMWWNHYGSRLATLSRAHSFF